MKISSSMSATLFALIFPRAQRACTFNISAERNVWLQSALGSFVIVCDYMETALFAIVFGHMETSLREKMLTLSLHLQMVRIPFFFNGFYGFLMTINLRSRLTILWNLNSVRLWRTHTLFVKSRARSSRCCDLAFTQVKNRKVCKMLWWNPTVGDLFENQGHCRVLGFVFFFLFFFQEEHL